MKTRNLLTTVLFVTLISGAGLESKETVYAAQQTEQPTTEQGTVEELLEELQIKTPKPKKTKKKIPKQILCFVPAYAMIEDGTAEEVEEPEEPKEPPKTFAGHYELTAYIETGNPCADGAYPSTGYTAACNDSSLWHKWIYIENYGIFYVHDTGGMSSNVIDLFVDSYDEAIQFGRREADVYIIGE